jgi:hypothetical protein
MLPFHVAVAIDNFPSKSLQARALDSIRERLQSSPSLPVFASFRGLAKVPLNSRKSAHCAAQERSNLRSFSRFRRLTLADQG